MHQILQKYQTLLPAAALAVLVVAGSPAVAYAQGGDAMTTTTTTSTSGSGRPGGVSTESSVSGGGSSATGNTAVRVESTSSTEVHTSGSDTNTTTESQRNSNNRSQAEDMVKGLRAEHKTQKTDAEREKSCVDHKDGVEAKFSSISRNSLAFETRIDGIYAKAKAYQVSSGLKPVDFATLTIAADAASAKAKVSVAALQAMKPAVDCANKSVATDVATFKTTAAQARTDLKAYKQAVKAVIASLRDAKHAAKAPVTTTNTKTETTGVKQ